MFGRAPHEEQVAGDRYVVASHPDGWRAAKLISVRERDEEACYLFLGATRVVWSHWRHIFRADADYPITWRTFDEARTFAAALESDDPMTRQPDGTVKITALA